MRIFELVLLLGRNAFVDILAVSLLLTSHITNASQWQQLTSACISNSSVTEQSALQLKVESKTKCAVVAETRVSGSHLVAEFNSMTSQCTVYQYQNVCQHIAASNNENNGCTVLLKQPVRDAAALREMQQLSAAWVFGENEDGNENLICSQSRRWQSHGVEFSRQGAAFDGVNSSMTLSNADLGNFEQGFTWLLRLKRQIGQQPILENYKCGSSVYGTHFWEAYGSRNLFYSPVGRFGWNNQLSTNNMPLTSDPHEFINIGITAQPNSNILSFYNQGQFISQSHVVSYNEIRSPELPHHCFIMGRPNENFPDKFTGTIRAVAVANASMSVDEINRFFDLL